MATLAEFSPCGSTGENDHDMLYNMDVTGPDGVHYQLLRELHHSDADVVIAKNYIRSNFDPVSIKIIKETT